MVPIFVRNEKNHSLNFHSSCCRDAVEEKLFQACFDPSLPAPRFEAVAFPGGESIVVFNSETLSYREV